MKSLVQVGKIDCLMAGEKMVQCVLSRRIKMRNKSIEGWLKWRPGWFGRVICREKPLTREQAEDVADNGLSDDMWFYPKHKYYGEDTLNLGSKLIAAAKLCPENNITLTIDDAEAVYKWKDAEIEND